MVFTPSPTETLVREVQPEKAELPRVTTLLGISIVFNLVHFSNAEFPITVHPSLMVTSVRLVHP